MTRKEELRFYIEAVIKGEIDYRKVGLGLVALFNILFRILEVIQSYVKALKIQYKRVPEDFKVQVKQLVLDNLADLNSRLTVSQIKAGIERLKVRYPIDEAATRTVARFLVKARAAGKSAQTVKGAAVSVASLATLLYGMYKGLDNQVKKRKVLATEYVTNEFTKELYDKNVYPVVANILGEVLNSKVKKSRELKSKFFKGIDRISEIQPELSRYLRTWGYGL